MQQLNVTTNFIVKGMTCRACENRIEKKLKDTNGILQAKARYSNNTLEVVYDEKIISKEDIKRIVRDLDYKIESYNKNSQSIEKVNYKKIIFVIFALIILFLFTNFISGFGLFNYFPQAQEGMSYAAIFVVGLLTSVHCVGMCGGICLSQTVNQKGNDSSNIKRTRPAFLYNLGRITSYTVLGAIVGALGSVISFNGVMRGAVAILAGIFMVIMGLNMLDLFPFLKKFNFKLPSFLTPKIDGQNNTPFYVGLVNGFMPCGPLQAMQLYALSTGDPLKGAISMFLFALGTSPLMFSFGALSAYLTKKSTKVIMTISAVLVIVLGMGMFNTGISMSGFLSFGTERVDSSNINIVIEDGYQIVEIDVQSKYFQPIVVQKDIPVKFNLKVKDSSVLNGCNNAIIIPEFGIKKSLQVGDNIVEFTPTQIGVTPYSCWMNMIRSSITVIE